MTLREDHQALDGHAPGIKTAPADQNPFNWYWGHGKSPEQFQHADSRDQAIVEAHASCMPGEFFEITERARPSWSCPARTT